MLCIFASLAQAGPAAVAEFRIESDRVKLALESKTSAVEQSMAATLAEISESYFGYLDWAAGALSPTDVGLAVVITEQNAGSCSPSTYIHLETALWGPSKPDGFPEELYHGCETPPFLLADTDEFENQLKERMVEMFKESADRIFVTTLKKVPLGVDLEIRHLQQELIVPMPLAELKASDSSTFLVEFPTATRTGKLNLRPHESLGTSGLLCAYTSLEVHPDIFISTAGFWHPKFMEVFPPGDLPTFTIFLNTYIADPHAGDGIADGAP